MKTGDRIFNGHTYFTVGKVRLDKFIARCQGAFFTGMAYDYHFSAELDAWVQNSVPANTKKIRKRSK